MQKEILPAISLLSLKRAPAPEGFQALQCAGGKWWLAEPGFSVSHHSRSLVWPPLLSSPPSHPGGKLRQFCFPQLVINQTLKNSTALFLCSQQLKGILSPHDFIRSANNFDLEPSTNYHILRNRNKKEN